MAALNYALCIGLLVFAHTQTGDAADCTAYTAPTSTAATSTCNTVVYTGGWVAATDGDTCTATVTKSATATDNIIIQFNSFASNENTATIGAAGAAAVIAAITGSFTTPSIIGAAAANEDVTITVTATLAVAAANAADGFSYTYCTGPLSSYAAAGGSNLMGNMFLLVLSRLMFAAGRM